MSNYIDLDKLYYSIVTSGLEFKKFSSNVFESKYLLINVMTDEVRIWQLPGMEVVYEGKEMSVHYLLYKVTELHHEVVSKKIAQATKVLEELEDAISDKGVSQISTLCTLLQWDRSLIKSVEYSGTDNRTTVTIKAGGLGSTGEFELIDLIGINKCVKRFVEENDCKLNTIFKFVD